MNDPAAGEQNDFVSFGPFVVDRASGLLLKEGADMRLPPKAMAVLLCLLQRPGSVMSKQDLLDAGWGGTAVTDGSLVEAVRKLREALGDEARDPTYVQTVHGRGYRFIATVQAASEPTVQANSAAGVSGFGIPEAQSSASVPTAGVEKPSGLGWPSFLFPVAALVLGGVALAVSWFPSTRAVGTLTPVHSFFPTDPADRIELASRRGPIAVSPDGSLVAFVGQQDGVSRLYLRSADQRSARTLEGTEGAANPFFSADGRWIAYLDESALTLNKISVAGGAPVELIDVQDYMGGAWGPDDILVVGMREGLWSIRADGSEPTELITEDLARGEKGFQHPNFLPDGENVLFAVVTTDDTSVDDADIAVFSLETGTYDVLIHGGTAPRYASSGHIVYARDGSLLAAGFDIEQLRVTGPTFVAMSDVATFKENGWPQFSMSADGSFLAYLPGGPMSTRQLVWVDRTGVSEPVSSRRDGFIVPSVSPDGARLAVTGGWSNHALWIYDLERGDFTRLTSGWDDHLAVWVRGGSHVAFQSNRARTPNIFWVQADGAGEVTPLWLSEHPLIPTSWSPGAEMLAFVEVHPQTGQDIWLLSLEAAPHAQPFVRTEFNERQPVFSPDGRFIAYSSDESGRSEIYVQTATSERRRWKISRHGGSAPRWSSDGSELFFWSPERWMMALPVQADFTGNPEALFDGTALRLPGPWTYNAHPSGRFVMTSMGPAREVSDVNVVQNWSEILRQRTPPAKQRP